MNHLLLFMRKKVKKKKFLYCENFLLSKILNIFIDKKI
jgi:hypothetical protein